MILSQISAMARNRVIGIKNTLPWQLPEDMKFFREKTKGHIMIMGRKTYESLGSPLPKRFHIIITRQPDYQIDHPQVKVVSTISEAAEFAKSMIPAWPEEVFIIGGGEIYKESLPVTNKIYLTIIEQDFEGDAYYPELPNCFQLVEKKESNDASLNYAFTTWERRY